MTTTNAPIGREPSDSARTLTDLLATEDKTEAQFDKLFTLVDQPDIEPAAIVIA